MASYNSQDTPFDELVEEKTVQRPTQPLPPRLVPPRARGGRLPVPTGELNDIGDLPPADDDSTVTAAYAPPIAPQPQIVAPTQVSPVAPVAPVSMPGASGGWPASTPAPASALQNDNDADPLAPLARRIPLGPLIGLSLVAGALLVVVLSAAVNALIPRPPVNKDGLVDGKGPQVAVVPEKKNTGDVLPEAAVEKIDPSPPESEKNALAKEEERQQAEKQRQDQQRAAERQTVVASGNPGSGERFEHSESGYAIRPPAGFSLRQKGRRTIWDGPQNTQLLVETTSSPEGSPRESWEQLDRSLSRKYGSRYRNLGIRDTEVAGLPAAVWEFELTGKDGKVTRKIDVGVHDGRTGYAVLGAAPVETFDQMRPDLEAAIQSLELTGPRERASRDEPSSTTRSAESGSSEERPRRNRRPRASDEPRESTSETTGEDDESPGY